MFLLWFVGILTFGTPAFAGSTAEDLLFAGRIPEAWNIAKVEAKGSPSNVEIQELYIDLAVHMGVRSLVESGYRIRIKNNPKDVLAHYLLGRASSSPVASQLSYQRALAINPKHARSHMGMGATYRNQGKLAEADAAYRKALMLDESLAEAWIGLQTVLLAGGMKVEALQAAELAVLNVGHRAVVYVIRAQLEPDNAISILEGGVKRAGRDPQIHVVLSQQYALAGRGSDAVKAANIALSIDRSHSTARRWRGLGWELQKRWLNIEGLKRILLVQGVIGDPPAGLKERVVQLTQDFPKSAIVRLLLAHVLTQQGSPKEAISVLEEALRLDPGNEDVPAVLGLAYMNQGLPTQALPLLKLATMARPEDVSLALARAEAMWRSGSTEKAILLMVALNKNRPDDVRIVLTLAGWLNEAGRTPDAYELLKEAATQNPDVRIAIAVAAAARDLGQQAEAADILEGLAQQMKSKKIREIAEQMRKEASKSGESK